VLPPVSKLTPGQAMYHYISGYTAKVAGTEVGVKDPEPTFSPCFGGPFLVWHPTKYAEMLAEKLASTARRPGWSTPAGPAAPTAPASADQAQVHPRDHRRDPLGRARRAPRPSIDPVFGLAVPTSCPDVPAEILQPRNTWADKAAYDEKAKKVARCSARTSRSTRRRPSAEVRAGGPKV
jgi:phosphoenolpyruvate carboxykinase (ATP)